MCILTKSLQVVLLLVFSVSVFAQEDYRNTTSSLSRDVSTLDKEAASKLTDQEKALAKRWHLKETDWVKYKEIMSGPRGIWSPGLDPITALGVEETDPEERKRYARIWMEVESRRYELEIAFEVERMKVGREMFKGQNAIDNQPWIDEWNRKRNEINHQIVAFMDVECLDDCENKFDSIYKSVDKNSRLDIFFKEGATADQIGKWATHMKLDPNLVKSRKITLNFDEGNAERMGVDTSKLPEVRNVDLKTQVVTKPD